MLYLLLTQIFALICDLFALVRRPDRQKDIEILILRQQLRILQRQHAKTPRLSQWEKLGSAALVSRFMRFDQDSKKKGSVAKIEAVW